MKISVLLATIAVATIALPLSSLAEEKGWQMPSLNPFGSKGKPPVSGRASDAPTSGWHAPKLWPKAAPAKRGASQPTTWSKMTGSTQKLFSKTADALNPWDDKQPKPPPKITGSNSIFTHNTPKPEPKSSSILPASWWSTETGAKKDQAPKTVNEFLSQQRPH